MSGKTKRKLFKNYTVKSLKSKEYSGIMTTSAVGHTNVMLHLLTYKKPNSAQVINRVTSIINMEEVRGLKKHKSTSWYKAVMMMTGMACHIKRTNIYCAHPGLLEF